MRILKTVSVTIVVILVLVAATGLLPRHVVVERSIEIDAPAATVFALVDGYLHFNSFSPWADIDPDAVYRFTGPRNGVGATMTWQSEHPDVGSGRQEVIESVPYEQVRSALNFDGMGAATSTFFLRPSNDITRVTWRFETDLGNDLVERWYGLLFDHWIGTDYERGLAKLAARAERLPPVDIHDLDISEVALTARPLLLSSHDATLDEAGMRTAMRAAYEDLQSFLSRHEIAVPAESIIITREWNEPEERWRFDVAYPLPENTVPEIMGTPFVVAESWQGTALRSILRGADHATSAANYEKISLYIQLHCYEVAGESWETYRSNPLTTPPEQLVTEIFFPVTIRC